MFDSAKKFRGTKVSLSVVNEESGSEQLESEFPSHMIVRIGDDISIYIPLYTISHAHL